MTYRVKRMREVYRSAFKHGVSEADTNTYLFMQYGSSTKMTERFFTLERQLTGA